MQCPSRINCRRDLSKYFTSLSVNGQSVICIEDSSTWFSCWCIALRLGTGWFNHIIQEFFHCLAWLPRNQWCNPGEYGKTLFCLMPSQYLNQWYCKLYNQEQKFAWNWTKTWTQNQWNAFRHVVRKMQSTLFWLMFVIMIYCAYLACFRAAVFVSSLPYPYQLEVAGTQL